jgi:hypothetical protein
LARKAPQSGLGGPDFCPPDPGTPSFFWGGVDDFSPRLAGRLGASLAPLGCPGESGKFSDSQLLTPSGPLGEAAGASLAARQKISDARLRFNSVDT